MPGRKPQRSKTLTTKSQSTQHWATPTDSGSRNEWNTLIARRRLFAPTAMVLAAGLLSGCTSLTGKKSDSADSSVEQLLNAPELPELVRDAASPRGLSPIKISGVALVNSLHGSGGPADPSPYRAQLVEEMRRNDVDGPNEILESENNAIVRVTAAIPAAARRGDTVDITLDSPPGNNASDLHGGWLLDTRMRVQQMIQGRVRKGDVLAMGTGSVLTRASFEGDADERNKTQGLILGGGTVQESRKMGLVLRPEYQHVESSLAVSNAINRRFFFFDGSTRRGVSKPVEDDYIELDLHPRYDGALGRYIAVVRAVAIDDRTGKQQSRLTELADKLSNPESASDAAIQLEALGESAIPTLLEGVASHDPELRFYAAEALAYLDREEAIEPLEEAIITEAAFRYPAFTALKGLDHPTASGMLVRLFDAASLETRYGAFDALRGRGDAASHAVAQPVGSVVNLYELESGSAPAIIISTRKRPEIVIFGKASDVRIKGAILGPNALIVKPDSASPDQLRFSRFQAGKDDRRSIAPATVRGLIEGIVAIGGDYADVIAVLRQAKAKGAIETQLAIDPLPKALRTYYRDEESS